MRFQKALVKMHGGKVSVTEEGQEEKVIPIENQDGIIGEIEYFVNLLDNRLENTKNPPESSAKTILLLETLRKSAENHCEMAWK